MSSPPGVPAGSRGAAAREAWTKRWLSLDPKVREAVQHPARAAAPAIAEAIAAAKKAAATATSKKATRVWSEATLDHLIPALPALIGGSADLTGSNNTRIKDQPLVTSGSFAGSYIHYGVREHAMAAAMNGMALHGGLIPYGGTFLVFTDYCRPAIRLSALMRQRVIYVMTHDFIGLGEDGPTHQPVEHLASLRAIPNLNVFRPADGVETAECWELAVRSGGTPSILALTRQAVPNLRTAPTRTTTSAPRAPMCWLRRRAARATSRSWPPARRSASPWRRGRCSPRTAWRQPWCPCPAGSCSRRSRQLTARQCSAPPRALPSRPPSVSAGSAGWARGAPSSAWTGFGASAPAAQLYEHFGITPAKVAAAARELVKSDR